MFEFLGVIEYQCLRCNARIHNRQNLKRHTMYALWLLHLFRNMHGYRGAVTDEFQTNMRGTAFKWMALFVSLAFLFFNCS